MKRIRNLFCAIALILTAFSFTACDRFAEVFSGPEDTWCRMDITIGQAKVCLDVIYTERTLSGTSSDNRDAKYMSSDLEPIEPGITMLITLDEDSDADSLVGTMFSELGKTTYIMKTFPKGSGSYGSGENAFTFSGSKTTWSAIYNLKADLQSSSQLVYPEAPFALTPTGSKYMQSVGEDFNWKKLIVTYLASSLLG